MSEIMPIRIPLELIGHAMNIGDIITIPKDRNGYPINRFDGSPGLQKFRVVAMEPSAE